MWWRALLITSLLMIAAGVLSFAWESRTDRTTPAAAAQTTDSIMMTTVSAGGEEPVTTTEETNIHEELSGYDVGEGKRLYKWFNCNTCHAEGGGDIGPALMDDKWIYGGAPRNIFASIVEGRPNGMPSFRGKIPDAQVWQLVAYIRSMSGHVPTYAPSSRSDAASSRKSDSMHPQEPMHHAGPPSPDQRATNK